VELQQSLSATATIGTIPVPLLLQDPQQFLMAPPYQEMMWTTQYLLHLLKLVKIIGNLQTMQFNALKSKHHTQENSKRRVLAQILMLQLIIEK